MKKLFIILSLVYFTNPASVFASKGSLGKGRDTLNIKCLLYSPNLFYGIELGEKPVRDMVDTLVDEVPAYDTTSQLNLVIVSARDLGFKDQTNILWDEILDSAESKGYTICPPQVAPELYVMSQNTSRDRALLLQKVSKGKPVFIGMDRIRHEDKEEKKGSFLTSIFKHKNYFDYVFCIKGNNKNQAYELGYSATDMSGKEKCYTWNNDDMFIFINKNSDRRNKTQFCKN